MALSGGARATDRTKASSCSGSGSKSKDRITCHYVYSSTDAHGLSDTHRSDLVRHDVSDGSSSERSRNDHAVDFYRPLIRPMRAIIIMWSAKALTAAWVWPHCSSLIRQSGRNLIEAGTFLLRVLCSILAYSSQLSSFASCRSRCFRRIIAQALVFILFAMTNIGYLWYNFIGCAAVLILARPATNYLSQH